MQQIPQQREPSTEITYRSLRDPGTDNSGESPGSSLRIRTLCRAYRVATGGGTLSDVNKDTLAPGPRTVSLSWQLYRLALDLQKTYCIARRR
jgi:hypothetical protein